jgi:hypothetical protein
VYEPIAIVLLRFGVVVAVVAAVVVVVVHSIVLAFVL